MAEFALLRGDILLNLQQRIDYANSTTNYYGMAAPSTVTSQARWQIRRETLDSQGRTTQIQFAGGTVEFNQIWDQRATLSYA